MSQHFRQMHGVAEQLGQGKVLTETGTTAHTGLDVYAIQVLSDATFTTLTENGHANTDAMTGFAIPAGITLYGEFTAFTLTLGKVRAYCVS